MKIRLVKEYDDHEPVILGIVSPKNHLLQEPAARKAVDEAWTAFQATEPDSDAEFVEYLVTNHQFRIVEDDAIDVIL